MDIDLFTIRLFASISLAVTLFVVFWAIYYQRIYSQERQAQLERAAELGRDSKALKTSQGSLLLQLAERYDNSESGQQIRNQLIRADFAKFKPSEYLAARILMGVIIFFGLTIFVKTSFWLGLGAALALSIFIPRLFLATRRNRYIKTFNRQLVEVAALMASSLRAGLSVPQAVNNVARKVPPPAGMEFDRVARELKLGISFEQAMQDMLQRVPSEDLKIMVTAILIQRQIGGNLVKALSELSIIMGERLRIYNEILTMTSEARFAVNIIIFLPLVLLIFMRTALPGLIDALFTEPVGWIILAIFGAVQAFAYVIIRGITNIKV